MREEDATKWEKHLSTNKDLQNDYEFIDDEVITVQVSCNMINKKTGEVTRVIMESLCKGIQFFYIGMLTDEDDTGEEWKDGTGVPCSGVSLGYLPPSIVLQSLRDAIEHHELRMLAQSLKTLEGDDARAMLFSLIKDAVECGKDKSKNED